MQEKGIAILCALIALTGIAALLALNSQEKPVELQISQIDFADKGAQVLIHGSVSSVRKTNENFFFKICQGSACIEVPLFKSLATALALRGLDANAIKAGDWLEVVGLVGEYQGKLQVMPSNENGFDLIRAKN